jgi:hypothetical protein
MSDIRINLLSGSVKSLRNHSWLRGARKTFALAVIVMAAASPVRAESAADAPTGSYLPLFVMYSGSPSTASLQYLREFLRANQMPDEVVDDAVETVVYKLKAFKTGFAYPIFRSETSVAGNTCVVTDSRHEHIEQAWTLLASERVYKPLLMDRTKSIEAPELLDNVFFHELFHCYDLVRHSLVETGTHIATVGPQYYAYWGEVGADAFAALQHLRSGGSPQLLKTVRDFRVLNLLNGDTVHNTARTLDYIIEHHDQETLRGKTTRDLIALADEIREQTALTREEFAVMDGAAARLNGEYEALVRDYRGLAKSYEGHLMRPTPSEVGPEQVSALLLQVRTALRNLGGDGSLASPYFAPLVQKFGDRSFLHTAQQGF